MITNTGKGIIAKFLIGQTPTYASYMALGCGARPLSNSDNQQNYSDQTTMQFEMTRVPITSRGFVKDVYSADITGASYSTGVVTYTSNHTFMVGDRISITGVSPTEYNLSDVLISDVTPTTFSVAYNTTFGTYVAGGVATTTRSKVVLAADLPSEQRYQISEIGIYSAKSNPSATNRDSRVIYSFTESENWEYHDSTNSGSVGATISAPLYGSSTDGIIKPNDENVAATYPVFRTTSNNAIFNSALRIERYEVPRFLGTTMMIPGDMSYLESNAGVIDVKDRATNYPANGTHIHLQDDGLNLGAQSSLDELRIAFSIVNKDAAYEVQPSRVLIMVEFSSDDVATSDTYARFEIDTNYIDFDPTYNRYIVATKKLSELTKSANFTWNSVKLAKIYTSVFIDGQAAPSDQFYIALDAIRLENVSTENPLYGLVGYAVTRTADSLPILKERNTSSSIEFRYGMDVI